MAFQIVKLLDPTAIVTGGLVPKGAYAGGTTYAVGDSVSYNGSSYVAIQGTTGNLPTNTTYWQILAQEGTTGSQGIQGIQGVQGVAGTNGTNGTNGAGVVAGGTTHQALTKKSNTDYDTQFETIDKTFVGLSNVPNLSFSGSNTGDQNLSGLAANGANSDITSLTGLTTPLALTEGGTGSATQNFVDLTTAQTVGGAKTFSSAIVGSLTGAASSNVLKSGDTMSGTLNSFTVTPVITGTYTLGDSTHYYSNLYATRHYLNSTAYLDGGTAGVIQLQTYAPSSGSADYTAVGLATSDSGTYTGAIYGLLTRPVGNVTTKWVIGAKFNPQFNGTGGLSKLSAFYCVPETISGFTTGTITDMMGFEFQPYTDASGGTITNLYGVKLDAGQGAGAPTITNYFGLRMNNLGKAVGTQYGIYIDSLTSGASNYAIYTNVGLVRFGDVMFPVQAVTASAPPYVKGGIYFDTTLNKLRVGGASGWETVTSV